MRVESGTAGIGLRVLLVEDDPSDAELTVQELRRCGFDVSFERVDTAEAMRDALERGGLDIVISDARLPRFSAAEALELHKRLASDLPFFIVSGAMEEEQAVECLRNGAHDFFVKGRLARLATAVARELAEADNRRARRRAESEREEASGLLLLSQERYRRATEVARVAVWEWNLDSGEMCFEPDLRASLGYGDGELRNHVDDWTKLVHPEDREHLNAAVQAHLAGESPLYETELRCLHKAGDVRWFLHRGTALRDGSGRPVRMIGATLDITERHGLQQQFHQAQKMEALGLLSGGIAHDFNNLLGVIGGHAELALRGLPSGHAQRSRLEQILKATEAATRLTRQLLAFGRGQMLQPKLVDLDAVVAETEPMLHRLIGEDVRLRTVPAKTARRVRADAVQLQQVILNLAVNARDAMPRGGELLLEVLQAELDEAYVRSHGGARPGPHLVLAVSDTGHGMDAATQARIFEPFFTTKAPGSGTGLGLASVHGIVSQSGGHVTVYSEPGSGTTFRVYLPAASGVEDAPTSEPERERPTRGTESVLLVEDEPALRGLIREVLEGAGHEVEEAADPARALGLIEAGAAPELLVTDIVMPGMSGYDLAERIARNRPGIHVLYLSGYTREAIGRHGVPDSGIVFLEKPFGSEALLRKVREALETAPARALPTERP